MQVHASVAITRCTKPREELCYAQGWKINVFVVWLQWLMDKSVFSVMTCKNVDNKVLSNTFVG